MRLSESLSALEGPIALAPSAVSSNIGPVVASGDAFFAPWSDTYTPVPPMDPTWKPWSPVYESHLIRIPLSGPIDAKSSVPFRLVPTPRRRAVTP